jgi:hypothetical protein
MSTARAVARVVQTTESVVGRPVPGALPGAVIASFVLLGVSPPPVALAGLVETRRRCIGELAASISGSCRRGALGGAFGGVAEGILALFGLQTPVSKAVRPASKRTIIASFSYQ